MVSYGLLVYVTMTASSGAASLETAAARYCLMHRSGLNLMPTTVLFPVLSILYNNYVIYPSHEVYGIIFSFLYDVIGKNLVECNKIRNFIVIIEFDTDI